MSTGKEIITGDHHIVFGGGDPLPGAPKSWDEFHKWVDKANADKEEEHEPVWSSDCHFKLDFDGALVRISSRFYPPAKFYGPTWDGDVVLYVGEQEITKKHFDCINLYELKKEVEKYISELRKKITEALKIIYC